MVLRNVSQILGWAAGSPTREVCGVVVDEVAYIVRNRSDNDDSFVMAVDDLMDVPGIHGFTGVWHSHPDRYPYPSDGDWDNHPEGKDLFIVSGGAVRCFELSEEKYLPLDRSKPELVVPTTRTVWSS